MAGILAWDGAAWTVAGDALARGSSEVPAVYALATFDDGSGNGTALHAGGLFDRAGPFGASGFVRLDACDPFVFADLTADRIVDRDDLAALLNVWGNCPGACLADLDGDHAVGVIDLLLLLANWS